MRIWYSKIPLLVDYTIKWSPNLKRIFKLKIELYLLSDHHVILRDSQNILDIYIYILKWVGPWRDLYFFRIYLSLLLLRTCVFPACCFALHIAFLIGFSMRLELSRVCSLNGFQLVIGLYRGHSSLFLRVCLIGSILYLPLIFYIV